MKLDGFLTTLLRSICSPSLTSIKFDLNDYGFYVSMQEHVDRALWSEVDTILANLTRQSNGGLGLQLRSSRLKNMDWQDLLPLFRDRGTLESANWTASLDIHCLSPHFDCPGPSLGPYATENSYWETVDRVHRRIEADTTIRKLEGPKSRTTDGSSLAEKVRRRNVKKRRAAARPA